MDQSLRTVATQLLNVTNPQDVRKVNNKDFIKVEHRDVTTPNSSEKNTPSLIRDKVNSENSNLEPVMSYGRPINSKFSYFETSHPGQAMAMTEEELEREMSTTRLITAYKNHPTTTGGISTWILLNPPSTTVKSAEVEKTKTQQPFQTEVRLTVRPSSSIEKVETIPQPEEKTTPQLTPVITTEKVTVITKKPTATTMKKVATTLRPERVTQDSGKTETASSTTLKVTRTTTTSTSTTTDGTATLTTVLTTKKSQPPRTTSKPKVTTPKTTSHSKPPTAKPATIKPTTTKPNRPKPTRKTTNKPETVKNETSATGKIEKVTFKPVPIITTPQNKPENTERPIFVTKIKASVLMDTQKTPTTLPATAATTVSASTMFDKSNLSNVNLVEVPVRSKPIGTKNNVLKVQLKKPVDETTQIEIEPIKVNAPILKIEKVDKNKMDEIMVKDVDDLNASRIDLKFDFNPELTKINVETQTEVATSTASTSAPTTKRPRHNSKRKKNKTRRRKPSRPSSTTVAMMPILRETSESVTDSTYTDNAVQESKIAPETKIGNSTKTKKKQPQKQTTQISTQIYNFLSREVMPSFGVMSLVGLGLGLASYFLYPFGGTITRRNYEVEPNYKYNMDEYGGNYGQSEEEMLSKVFQGMTNYENKYPAAKDSYNSNYYHYQHYDGAYDTQTKKVDQRYPSISTSPVYKTAGNTQSAVKYRNTDFRYPEVQTTPVYYDRKRPDLTTDIGASSAANRQFVVGNVPKEYSYDVKVANLPVDKKGVGYMSTEVGQTQFERDVVQSFDFPNAAALHSYGHLGASTVRPDDGYEEIEITPTAVAVEHGPRSLKVRRTAINEGQRRSLRSKRESVIQIIPSKRELEEEREEAEKEEDLSNEILDIIDSALPGGGEPHKTNNNIETNEVEDLEGQKRKQQEEANTRAKISTLKTVEHTEETTESSSTSTIGKTDDGTSSENSFDKDITHSSDPKNPEATTVEWFDSSTTKKPPEGFSLLNFVKKVAEIKFRLGLTILKHASEGFARYLGHVQKRINGEE